MSGELQQVLDELIKKLPRRFAEELFRKKLKEAGREPKKHLIEKLANHVLNGDEIIWDDEAGGDFTITITDEDMQDFDNSVNEFLKNEFPKEINRLTINISRSIIKTLKNNWQEQSLYEKQSNVEFQKRLEERWAQPLALLRIMLNISREIGSARYAKFARSRAKRNRHRNSVLFRLHARACQVTAEIIHLLAGGFADGAMARWRTLYEIGIVATLIAEHGDELAEMYLAHEVAESKRGLRVYLDTYKQLGYRPPAKRNVERLEKRLAVAVAKFGPDFKNDYGWAAKLLKKSKPTFVDLEAAADRSVMRTHYKMASHNVHAGIKGITVKLGLLTEGVGLIAGASNAGLDEPGQNTAITLSQIFCTLLGPRWSFDDLVMLKMFSDLQVDTTNSFVRVGRKLKREVRKQFRQSS